LEALGGSWRPLGSLLMVRDRIFEKVPKPMEGRSTMGIQPSHEWVLEASGGVWEGFGSLLEGSWWHLEASWRHLGGSWRRLEVSWKHLGGSWRRLEVSWRHLGGSWRLKRGSASASTGLASARVPPALSLPQPGSARVGQG